MSGGAHRVSPRVVVGGVKSNPKPDMKEGKKENSTTMTRPSKHQGVSLTKPTNKPDQRIFNMGFTASEILKMTYNCFYTIKVRAILVQIYKQEAEPI